MPSASPGEKQKLRDMITDFYAIAGKTPPSQLQINDEVAVVFASMMRETEKCTKAMSYVVSRPVRTITVVWIATYIWGIIYDVFSKELSATCVKSVLWKWDQELERVGNGL